MARPCERVIALEDLKDDDTTRVLAAIQQLSGDLRPAARNGLNVSRRTGCRQANQQAAREGTGRH